MAAKFTSPVPPELLQRLAEQVDGQLPRPRGRRLGFTLLVFDFDPGDRLGYVSNANRSNMVRTLREMADRLEAGTAGITQGHN